MYPRTLHKRPGRPLCHPNQDENQQANACKNLTDNTRCRALQSQNAQAYHPQASLCISLILQPGGVARSAGEVESAPLGVLYTGSCCHLEATWRTLQLPLRPGFVPAVLLRQVSFRLLAECNSYFCPRCMAQMSSLPRMKPDTYPKPSTTNALAQGTCLQNNNVHFACQASSKVRRVASRNNRKLERYIKMSE